MAEATGRAPLAPLEGDATRIAPAVVEQAAEWLVRLQMDDTDAQRRAWSAWREARPEHERAWQRVAMLSQDLRATGTRVNPRLAASTLNAVAARQSRRTAMKWVLGVGGAGVITWTAHEQLPWEAWAADYSTEPGQQRALVLEDGTRLELNTDSAVDVRYSDGLRLLTLHRGEIRITTGKDVRQRPFLVRTDAGEIRPLGTRFVVYRREAPAGDVLVSVSEGAVQIRPRGVAGDAWHTVQAGQQATFTAGSVSAAGPAPALAEAWVNGMLVANRMRLDLFLAELGRYRRGVLRCDPAVAGQLVTGAFPVADTDKVLAMLEDVLPVTVGYRTRYWVTVAAR